MDELDEYPLPQPTDADLLDGRRKPIPTATVSDPGASAAVGLLIEIRDLLLEIRDAVAPQLVADTND